MAQRNGTGMFPRELMHRFPLLSLEEEGRLNRPAAAGEVHRVGICLLTVDGDAGQRTHPRRSGQTPYRLQAHPHGPRPLKRPVAWRYTEMGNLVADAGNRDWDELTAEYGAMLIEGLGVMGCKRSGRGEACQRAPAPDGLLEEPPVERRQRLPEVGWSFWASSRTTGRACYR